ncbi:cellulose biosynthesis protein BcsQ [Azotobacter salinestris]|uniref:cellulose biosynthesis protein BcsQ n=1 Tax=Azotobacter salinestris TaxID=69964 RepID=UPI0032DF1E9B
MSAPATSLTLRGVRGGVGVSSLLAALAYALQGLGERVLLVDMCPENLLRLHFDLPLGERDGWARATLDGHPWSASAWCLGNHMHLLPYGCLTVQEQAQMETYLRREPELWARRQASLAGHFDWILFDLPQRLPGHCLLGACDLPILLLEVDVACHVLLQQQPMVEGLLLVNRFDSASKLQRDLLLVWQQTLSSRLLPQVMHLDTAMPEALAHKQPVGHYAPTSLVALDAASLATWLLTRRAPLVGERAVPTGSAEQRVTLHVKAGVEPAAGG